MQATARRLSVVSATSCARRRLIRDVRRQHTPPRWHCTTNPVSQFLARSRSFESAHRPWLRLNHPMKGLESSSRMMSRRVTSMRGISQWAPQICRMPCTFTPLRALLTVTSPRRFTSCGLATARRRVSSSIGIPTQCSTLPRSADTVATCFLSHHPVGLITLGRIHSEGISFHDYDRAA